MFLLKPPTKPPPASSPPAPTSLPLLDRKARPLHSNVQVPGAWTDVQPGYSGTLTKPTNSLVLGQKCHGTIVPNTKKTQNNTTIFVRKREEPKSCGVAFFDPWPYKFMQDPLGNHINKVTGPELVAYFCQTKNAETGGLCEYILFLPFMKGIFGNPVIGLDVDHRCLCFKRFFWSTPVTQSYV